MSRRRRRNRIEIAPDAELGLAWYSPEAWERLRETADDVHSPDDTYEDWARQALRAIRDLESHGRPIRKVPIDIDAPRLASRAPLPQRQQGPHRVHRAAAARGGTRRLERLKLMTLRCTQRVRERLHLPQALPEPALSSGRLGDWYVHLVRFGRPEFAIATSERSLLTVLFPARGLRTMRAPNLRAAVALLLEALEVPSEAIAREISAMEPVVFGRSTNRRVLKYRFQPGSDADAVFPDQRIAPDWRSFTDGKEAALQWILARPLDETGAADATGRSAANDSTPNDDQNADVTGYE